MGQEEVEPSVAPETEVILSVSLFFPAGSVTVHQAPTPSPSFALPIQTGDLVRQLLPLKFRALPTGLGFPNFLFSRVPDTIGSDGNSEFA